MIKNPPANAGDIRDPGSIPGLGRFPGEECGNSVQYSCLENPMDRGAWWAMVHGVTQSQTRLKRLSTALASSKLFIVYPNHYLTVYTLLEVFSFPTIFQYLNRLRMD